MTQLNRRFLANQAIDSTKLDTSSVTLSKLNATGAAEGKALVINSGGTTFSWQGIETAAARDLAITTAMSSEVTARNLAIQVSAAGLIGKGSVVAATNGPLLATYDNGTNGVGATLTGAAIILSVEEHAVQLNDRILVKDQANAWENGIYDVTTVGTASVPWVFTRASDFDGTPDGEVHRGSYVWVTGGATQKQTSWWCISPMGGDGVMQSSEIGTSGAGDIVWTVFNQLAAYQGYGNIAIVERNGFMTIDCTAETTARDLAISTAVSSEATARDLAISTAVSSEATARDLAISTAVSSEATARDLAIGSEATARDLAISTAISGITPAAITTEIIHTLSSSELSAKAFDLPHTPIVDRGMLVVPVGGVPQFRTLDFAVSSNTVSWTGLGMDALSLAENDKLYVSYSY